METQKSPLFTRDFTLVVIGQIISLFGNAILHFALPLYLLRETGSIALFGAVNACSFLPMILMGPIGGTAADRVHKGRIMVGLDFLTAGLTVTYTLLWGKAPLVPLVIVTLMLLYAIAGAYQPAVQASLPLLLAPDRLTQGNAVINMVATLSNLLGPALGGVIFGLWGLGPILTIGGVCFFCSAVMEIFIRVPHEKRPRSAGILNVPIEREGAMEIAKRSRGTPRIANRMLRRVRDFAQVRAGGVITKKVADEALTALEIDHLGLDSIDHRMLRSIMENYRGGPVGLETLAATINEEAVTLEDVYEPYLMQLGFLTRTPRGRCVTPKAYAHLGLPVPGEPGGLDQLSF